MDWVFRESGRIAKGDVDIGIVFIFLNLGGEYGLGPPGIDSVRRNIVRRWPQHTQHPLRLIVYDMKSALSWTEQKDGEFPYHYGDMRVYA